MTGRCARFAVCGAAVTAILLCLFARRAIAQAGPAVTMDGQRISALGDAIARHLDYMPNEVIVRFKAGVTRAGAQRALMALRARPDFDGLQWRGAVAIATDLTQPDAAILAAQLRSQPEVEYAEPNYLLTTTATPNDPSYGPRQWNMAALDMPRAWDINAGASGAITVAVVDTGVTTINATMTFRTWSAGAFVNATVPYASSPELPLSRLTTPFDFVLTNSSVVMDMGHHGTHVSSTIGEETNNALNLAGIAYRTKIMPVKVLACYWDRQFIRSRNNIPGYEDPAETKCRGDVATTSLGIRYAVDHGARVINMSIDGLEPSVTLADALKYAVANGVFVAVSAGNDYEIGSPTTYPAKYAETIEGVMAVAAVGRTLERAYYSNAGSYVEVAAPGGDTRAGGLAGGVWQLTLDVADSDPSFTDFPTFARFREASLQGTSMASPHVAGTAALLYSQLGAAATPALVERIIKQSARACTASSCDASASGARGRNDLFGVGLIQPRAALFGLGLRR